MLVELWADVYRGTLDGVEQQLGHAGLLDAREVRLEDALGRLEALRTNLDQASVRQLVRLNERCRLVRELLVEVEVVTAMSSRGAALTHLM